MTATAKALDTDRIVERLVHAEVEFKELRIPLDHVRAAQIKLDVWRKVGRRTMGEEQKILSIVGPSHSGKSTIVKDWRERITRKENPPEGCHPILHVSLTNHSTVKSMAADIVNGLGRDALPPEILEDTLRRHGPRRARFGSRDTTGPAMWLALRALVNAGTELLVIDELQHLVRSDNATETKWSVADAVKWLAIKGPCPIVCVGIRRVIRIIAADNNPQIANRQTSPIILDPLDMGDKEQWETFGTYVRTLDSLIVKHGILRQTSGLADAHVIPLLHDVSLGILGRVSRLVEAATEITLMDGRERITDSDLSNAVDRYAKKLKLTTHNPWLEGARDVRVIRKLTAEAE